jgi:hypothetical protein
MNNLTIKEIGKELAIDLIQSTHYSKVMPRLTKHYLGCFLENKLVGVVTLGWGTQPKGTINKMFPGLETKDYYEIGKMCMDDKMPRNSESQMLSLSFKWLKENTDIKYLFTWADGIVGKPGYVYQAANFLYGGFSITDTYVTEGGEKVHPRTIQGILPNEEGLKYGHRPNFEQLKELKLSRVKGKQFRYIYPMSKKYRKYLKKSTVEWSLSYPKHSDLMWRIKAPGETEYTQTETMPFNLSKETVYNKGSEPKSNLMNFFN